MNPHGIRTAAFCTFAAGLVSASPCLAGMAEFAESQLVGTELDEALQRVDDHIRLCPECAEEYEILREALRANAPERD